MKNCVWCGSRQVKMEKREEGWKCRRCQSVSFLRHDDVFPPVRIYLQMATAGGWLRPKYCPDGVLFVASSEEI